MKVKVYKIDDEGKTTKDLLGEFEVKRPSFSEKKHLLHRSMALYPGGIDGEIDDTVYEEISDYVMNISGLKEKDFEKFTMQEVLRIINQIFSDYQGLDEKKS